MVGSVVSHYRVEEHLGGGGMGVVYKGLDLHLDRPVALKFLPQHLGSSYQAETRFIQEAKAASALDHSHIVTIFDIDRTEGGQLFIVMAYYPGETIKKKVERGPMPLTESVLYTIQVAEALEEAHHHGIVHRDIKPSNILVTEEGRAKLVDFGLARLVEETTLTDPGAVIGTTLYMSPEQIRGERIDHRTDIWSLGVVLYQMVTGKLPFTGPTAAAVMHAIIDAECPKLGRSGLDGPEALQAILDRALAKESKDRYQNTVEMLVDLRALHQSMTGSTAVLPAPPRRSDRRGRLRGSVFVALAAVLAIAVGLAVLDGWRSESEVEHVRAPPLVNSDAQRFFEQALEYERRGDLRVQLENAEQMYRRALELEPDHPHLQAHLANLLIRLQLSFSELDLVGEAESLIVESLHTNPVFACVLVAKGYLHIIRDEFELAEKTARQAVALAPESSRAQTLLGEALAGVGEEQEALTVLRAAIDLEDGHLWAHPTLARLLMNMDRTEEAVEEYKQILDLLPDSVNALNNLGAIYVRDGRLEEAEPLFRRILEVQPDSMAAMNLGTVNFYLGRMEEARELYLQAHELAPEDPLLTANLGEFFEEVGDRESARLWFEKALAIYDAQFEKTPPQAELLGDRAFYAAKAGRTDEAIHGIVEALTSTERDQLQPDSLVLFQAAKIYALAERRAETLSYTEQAIAAGYPPAQFEAEPSFRAFLEDPDFLALVTSVD